MGLQGQAVKKAVKKWGGNHGGSGGKDSDMLPFPICKCSFKPFVDGERRYGCFRHHSIRQDCIDSLGLRKGWEDFNQFRKPVEQHSKRSHPRPRPRDRVRVRDGGEGEDVSNLEKPLLAFNLLRAIRATAAKKLASISSIIEQHSESKPLLTHVYGKPK